MDIRIVSIESDPPVWRVYLNHYFIVCDSEAEARETAQRALVSTRKTFRVVHPCNTRLVENAATPAFAKPER